MSQSYWKKWIMRLISRALEGKYPTNPLREHTKTGNTI